MRRAQLERTPQRWGQVRDASLVQVRTCKRACRVQALLRTIDRWMDEITNDFQDRPMRRMTAGRLSLPSCPENTALATRAQLSAITTWQNTPSTAGSLAYNSRGTLRTILS